MPTASTLPAQPAPTTRTTRAFDRFRAASHGTATVAHSTTAYNASCGTLTVAADSDSSDSSDDSGEDDGDSEAGLGGNGPLLFGGAVLVALLIVLVG